jgi:hypothetical protein
MNQINYDVFAVKLTAKTVRGTAHLLPPPSPGYARLRTSARSDQHPEAFETTTFAVPDYMRVGFSHNLH